RPVTAFTDGDLDRIEVLLDAGRGEYVGTRAPGDILCGIAVPVARIEPTVTHLILLWFSRLSGTGRPSAATPRTRRQRKPSSRETSVHRNLAEHVPSSRNPRQRRS